MESPHVAPPPRVYLDFETAWWSITWLRRHQVEPREASRSRVVVHRVVQGFGSSGLSVYLSSRLCVPHVGGPARYAWRAPWGGRECGTTPRTRSFISRPYPPNGVLAGPRGAAPHCQGVPPPGGRSGMGGRVCKLDSRSAVQSDHWCDSNSTTKPRQKRYLSKPLAKVAAFELESPTRVRNSQCRPT